MKYYPMIMILSVLFSIFEILGCYPCEMGTLRDSPKPKHGYQLPTQQFDRTCGEGISELLFSTEHIPLGKEVKISLTISDVASETLGNVITCEANREFYMLNMYIKGKSEPTIIDYDEVFSGINIFNSKVFDFVANHTIYYILIEFDPYYGDRNCYLEFFITTYWVTDSRVIEIISIVIGIMFIPFVLIAIFFICIICVVVIRVVGKHEQIIKQLKKEDEEKERLTVGNKAHITKRTRSFDPLYLLSYKKEKTPSKQRRKKKGLKSPLMNIKSEFILSDRDASCSLPEYMETPSSPTLDRKLMKKKLLEINKQLGVKLSYKRKENENKGEVEASQSIEILKKERNSLSQILENGDIDEPSNSENKFEKKLSQVIEKIRTNDELTFSDTEEDFTEKSIPSEEGEEDREENENLLKEEIIEEEIGGKVENENIDDIEIEVENENFGDNQN